MTSKPCSECGALSEHLDQQQRCPACSETFVTPEIHFGEAPTVDMDTIALDKKPVFAATQASADALLGREFANYEIKRFLGQGGMAKVYLANHLSLRRLCAIKFLRKPSKSNDGTSSKFLDEARAAAALNHPNVVTIYTIGAEQGREYIEMEYVEGQSLSRMVNAHTPLGQLEAAKLMLQINAALVAAHELEMIHRDIKPHNVMVSNAGTAKLADFGLAKSFPTDESSAESNTLVGTPQYMAPELLFGEPASPCSDIYALGATYFQLLTGRLPLEARTLNELVRKHNSQWVNVCEKFAHRLLDATQIIATCLASDPAERFQSAGEVYAEISKLFGSLRSLDDLLREALRGLDLPIRGTDDHFQVVVPLSSGRSQTVHIALTRDRDSAEHVVRIFSTCAPVDPDYLIQALSLNATNPYGAIAIEQIDGQDYFVMANAYPQATCDPLEVRRSVMAIAECADRFEAMLTGTDKF